MDKGFERFIGQVEKYISYILITVGLLFAIYQVFELVYLVFTNLYESMMKGEFYAGKQGTPIAGLFFSIFMVHQVVGNLLVGVLLSSGLTTGILYVSIGR